jgi:lipopolysaccharide export system permease protein
VVWFASGQSLVGFIRPVLSFGLPLVILTALLSLVAQPWAKQKNDEYIERFEKREDLQQVAPGRFRESASSNRIFFVEGVAGDSAIVQNVFVNTTEASGNTVVVAKEGVIEEDDKGMRYLVLKNGRRYQGTPGQADFQSMEFERYNMRVAAKVPVTGAELSAEALPTTALLASRSRFGDAELLWRVALPVTCLLLILLAIPLGFVNPRAGSSANLIIALLIFFSYNNLNKMMEASVRQDKLSLAAAWWPLHLAAALLVIGMFMLRLNVNHRFHPLAIYARYKRKRMATGAAA